MLFDSRTILPRSWVTSVFPGWFISIDDKSSWERFSIYSFGEYLRYTTCAFDWKAGWNFSLDNQEKKMIN
jgi:hypothetical protein